METHGDDPTSQEPGAPSGWAGQPLIGAEELVERLDEVKLVDIRWALTDPTHGVSTYRQGHIPGAVFADLDHDLSGPPGPGRHPLPDVATFAATLGRLGITPEDEVVSYDDMGGTVAARLWWMLVAIGHARSRLLDGGYRAWVESGYPVEIGDRIPARASYPVPGRFTGTVDRRHLDGMTLIDARAPERYRGDVEPVDPKAGHIPGAINRPAPGNLGPDGRFRASDELDRIYAGLGERVVVSCGSGVTGCHDALAMVIAGLPMPLLYVGSFSEWSNLDLPVETGE